MGAVGKELFAVRVSLPKDVTAVLLCDKSMNVEALTTKALSYLKNTMGIILDQSSIQILAEEKTLNSTDLLLDIPYVNSCVNEKKGSPTILIKTNDQETENGDDLSDLEENLQPQTPLDQSSEIGSQIPNNTRSTSVSGDTSSTETPTHLPPKLAAGRSDDFRASAYGKPHVPAEVYSINFVFPGDISFVCPFSGDSTIKQIKEDTWRLKDSANIPDLKEPDLYCLKYKGQNNEIVELFDEQQLLQNVSMIPYWKSKEMDPTFIVDFKKKQISKQEQLFNMKIGTLIGFGLYQFDYLKDPEVDTFRRRIARVRSDALKDRDTFNYLVDPIVETYPASSNVLSKTVNGKIKMRLHLTFKSMDKTLLADVNETPRQVIEKFIPKNKLNLPEGSTVDDFVLKVCGQSDYLFGEHQMIDFRFIRKSLLKEEPINLSLAPIASIINNGTPEIQEENDFIEDSIATAATHEQLTVEGRELNSIRYISLWDVSRLFRLQVVGGENFSVGNVESMYVEIGIYHGGQPMASIKKTPQVKSSAFPRWDSSLPFDIATYNIPRAARLCITVYGRWNAKKPMSQDKENDVYPLGWVNLLLMDYKGILRTGLVKVNLWPGEKANPIGTCVSNPKTLESASIYLKFDTYAHPVIYPTQKYENDYKEYNKMLPPPTNDQDAGLLEHIITSDPLTRMNEKAINLVWMYRFHCLRRPEALPKVLLSARWSLLEDVIEVRKMLLAWVDLKTEIALELLDANFPDEHVRAYAVSRLSLLSDDQVIDYLVQLVQVLKYESYHDNALARFLLTRALRNKRVGHHFFWYLKAEMEQPEISVRFALLLEAYLRGTPSHTDELIKQNTVLTKLADTANAIKNVKGSTEKKEVLMNRLSKLNLPDSFQLPLNPKLEAKNLIIEKCKYMDSKKLPLWLVFENADSTGRPTYIIFKSGDDLRQDLLTLQMISIMDKLWQQENLDLRMIPYGCISTGNDVGMIEVVLNAETVSNIQQAYGGSTAAFRDTPIQEWIRAQHKDDEDYEKAVETFTLSCAGYCVATYVLGIGDRHNDNIMVTKSGHLFHIDFGHFLGNIKRKFGFKRERAPFVLTPDFVYVMGGSKHERFHRFLDLCSRAYLILRRNAYMFINLFAMMLSTGIPELKSTEDIYYLRDALCLDKTEEEASQEFKNLVFESLRLGWSTQLNWYIHNLAHSR